MKKFIIAIIIALCCVTTAFADDAFIHNMNDFTADCDTIRVELQGTWYDAHQAGETLEINNVPHDVELWLGSLNTLQVNYEKYIGEDLSASGVITAVPHGNGNHNKCVKGTVNFWCRSYVEIAEITEEPETPETPETPDVPEIPVTPEIPEEPEVPVIPEEPTEPETPEVPVIPESPEVPETPAIPEVPETPNEPETPAEPEAPVEPEITENNTASELAPNTADPGIDVLLMVAALSLVALLGWAGYKYNK